MKLRKIKEEIDNLDLPLSQKNSVISLIELVIEHNMEKFISEIRSELKTQNSEIRSELKTQNSEIRSELKTQNRRINLLVWFMGAVVIPLFIALIIAIVHYLASIF